MLLWKGCHKYKLFLTVSNDILDLISVHSYSQSNHGSRYQVSFIQSVQSFSRVQLCNPMDCSMPSLAVHHQLPEFTQTHVHWVSDASQPSHPLSSPSYLPSIFPSIRVIFFASGGQSIGASASASVLPMHGLVGSPCSPRDSQESSPTRQFKSISSSALSFFYNPTLTSIHDYWENHSFD